ACWTQSISKLLKATLTVLLDHLSLVASFHDFNRMNSQNIAVCFGPVLLNQNQEPGHQGSCGYARCEEIASAVDFKRHIEVLHYLLQAWPGQCRAESKNVGRACHYSLLLSTLTIIPARSAGCWGVAWWVAGSAGYWGVAAWWVAGRAGCWGVACQEYGLVAGPGPEADYAEVAGSDSENEMLDLRGLSSHSQTVFVRDFALVDDPEVPFSPCLNLKDFDALILDLERELSKQINVCL
uniref:Rho-GAP domain-containing protein n=1 Tax=Pelodiscus sinensis TaxID=13735 RepID=K7FVF8_PELSI